MNINPSTVEADFIVARLEEIESQYEAAYSEEVPDNFLIPLTYVSGVDIEMKIDDEVRNYTTATNERSSTADYDALNTSVLSGTNTTAAELEFNIEDRTELEVTRRSSLRKYIAAMGLQKSFHKLLSTSTASSSSTVSTSSSSICHTPPEAVMCVDTVTIEVSNVEVLGNRASSDDLLIGVRENRPSWTFCFLLGLLLIILIMVFVYTLVL